MDDGLRAFAIISLTDISCAWNTLAIAKQGPLFQLGINLYAYTTDHGLLRARLAEQKVFTRNSYLQAHLSPGARAGVKVARVKHGGDWYVGQNYAGMQHLADGLAGRVNLKLECGAAVDPSGLAAVGVQLAHLTGRQGVALGDAESAALKKFLEAGGLLFVEATMGDARFDTEFNALAAQLGLKVTPLAAADPLITGALGGATGYDVSSVKYRYSLRMERVGKPLPALFGLQLGDKLVGVYSPYDVSFSQTGFTACGCRGYEAEDALAILTNIVLLASTR